MKLKKLSALKIYFDRKSLQRRPFTIYKYLQFTIDSLVSFMHLLALIHSLYFISSHFISLISILSYKSTDSVGSGDPELPEAPLQHSDPPADPRSLMVP